MKIDVAGFFFYQIIDFTLYIMHAPAFTPACASVPIFASTFAPI